MFYVAKVYSTMYPSIVGMFKSEQNANDMARILTEETGKEHIVLTQPTSNKK